MVISAAGIQQLKNFEGLQLYPYLDDDKTTSRVEYSIGYGHQIQPGEEWMMQGITAIQAENILLNDLAKFSAAVNTYLQVSVMQNIFDSLVSFAYNIGVGNFKNSELLAAINRGAPADEIISIWKNNWDSTATAATRRNDEAEYAFSGYDAQSDQYAYIENTPGAAATGTKVLLGLAAAAAAGYLIYNYRG